MTGVIAVVATVMSMAHGSAASGSVLSTGPFPVAVGASNGLTAWTAMTSSGQAALGWRAGGVVSTQVVGDALVPYDVAVVRPGVVAFSRCAERRSGWRFGLPMDEQPAPTSCALYEFDVRTRSERLVRSEPGRSLTHPTSGGGNSAYLETRHVTGRPPAQTVIVRDPKRKVLLRYSVPRRGSCFGASIVRCGQGVSGLAVSARSVAINVQWFDSARTYRTEIRLVDLRSRTSRPLDRRFGRQNNGASTLVGPAHNAGRYFWVATRPELVIRSTTAAGEDPRRDRLELGRTAQALPVSIAVTDSQLIVSGGVLKAPTQRNPWSRLSCQPQSVAGGFQTGECFVESFKRPAMARAKGG